MKTENTVELLCKNGFIWLLLGTLISADSLIDKESCEKSFNKLCDYEQQTIVACIEQEEKNKILEFIQNGKKIIEKDLKKFQ